MNEEEKPKDEDIFEILESAISDVGYWRWWITKDDIVQLEFGGVQMLNSDTLEEKSKSAILALNFSKNSFFWVFDNGEKEGWHNDLHDDKIEPFEINGDYFEFNNGEAIDAFENEYKNKTVIKEAELDKQNIVAFKCGGVAVICGGEELRVRDKYLLSEQQIVNRNKLWWEYWKNYWKKKGSDEAYPEDYACEETIPLKTELTPGNEEWGQKL